MTLHTLLVEDNEDDAELILFELAAAGYELEPERVETPEGMSAALARTSWHVVISDHNLPRFSAPAALALLRNHDPDVPFVIVSGAIGEDAAVAAMKSGAADYVMKGNLARLGPAVDRALRERADRARRAQLEEELRQLQKLEAVGRMAGGIAHDFKNVLAAISGYAELLAHKLGDDPRANYAQQILKASGRGTGMVQQLLAFSRRQELTLQQLDLNEIVADSESMLQHLIGRAIKLDVRLSEPPATITADPVQMQQVLMNLAVNARDAIEGTGTLTIRTYPLDISPSEAALRPGLPPGPYAALEIRDTGCGMDGAMQAKIFEPFFTTKPEGQGTGLGLATVYGIVAQSSGRIEVASAPGQGTTFTVLLPRAEG